MTENIFEHILSSRMVDELNLGEEKMILQMFTHLCNSIDVRDSNSIESVLNIILDRVAFFPVRPADMKVVILVLKGTVSVISSDPSCKDGIAQFTTVPLKPKSCVLVFPSEI